jgi:hypothetical protein
MCDVTEECKKIIKGIFLVNAVGNRAASANKKQLIPSGKFTVLHIVDILKGSENKKVMDFGKNFLLIFKKNLQCNTLF